MVMTKTQEAVVGVSDRGSPGIEAVDLRKTYKGGVKALDGVTFAAAAGSITALVGPNGAGKSTLMRILTTLSRPDAGRARVLGLDVSRDAADVRRLVGVVGQGSGADPEATAVENLMLQGRVFGMERHRLDERTRALLERFGLTEAADRRVRSFSGGMRRRLDVALGLVHQPKVLFLDEPTTGLDPEVRKQMWDEIARLASGDRITVLLTTHYLEEADTLADRVVIVDRGRVVVEGEPDRLKEELRGDRMSVELAQEYPPALVLDALVGESAWRDAVVQGRHLEARADDAAATLPALLGALSSSGLIVASVTVARPTLDDVYLKHTGRTYTSADDPTMEVR